MNNLNFDEASYQAFLDAATEKYDFGQTCQRSDGSKYGTGGQCRQGTPTTPGSDDKKTSSKKSSGGGKMSADEKKALQVAASKGDKGAMKKLNEARAAGKIGKEAGWVPKSDQPKLRADGSVDTSGAKKPKGDGGKARKEAKASGEVADRKAAARKENEAKKEANARTDSKMSSARAAEIKAKFDRDRKAQAAKNKQFDKQQKATKQDGPEATNKQKAAARRNFQRKVNQLEAKIDNGEKLTPAEQAELKRAKASIRANS